MQHGEVPEPVNHKPGTAEVWQAYAVTPVTGATVVATLGSTAQDGTASFFGGVQGDIGSCGDTTLEGGGTVKLPGASLNLSDGYTWVLNSSTGYHSNVPGWVTHIYNHLPASVRNPELACGPVISGPDGPDNFGAPPGDAWA